MVDYNKCTDQEFDAILEEIVGEMSAGQILAYGDVNMILREELNNDVLDRWKARQEEESDEDEDDEPEFSQELLTKLNRLDRQQIVELLESASIQCYDNESDDVLLEALKVNIADGTISEDSIPD